MEKSKIELDDILEELNGNIIDKSSGATFGIVTITRRDLEKLKASNKKAKIKMAGILTFTEDVTPELAREQQLKKYKQMFRVAEYQQKLKESEDNIFFETKIEEDEKALEILNSEISSLETELRRVNSVIAENNSFKIS